MATLNSSKSSSDFEQYVREILECPICMETIVSVPVYQCVNGHVICKYCIPKLENCAICRDGSKPVRNLKVEEIVQGIQGPQIVSSKRAKSVKWRRGTARVYRSNDGELSIQLNLRTNQEISGQPTINDIEASRTHEIGDGSDQGSIIEPNRRLDSEISRYIETGIPTELQNTGWGINFQTPKTNSFSPLGMMAPRGRHLTLTLSSP